MIDNIPAVAIEIPVVFPALSLCIVGSIPASDKKGRSGSDVIPKRGLAGNIAPSPVNAGLTAGGTGKIVYEHFQNKWVLSKTPLSTSIRLGNIHLT